MREGRVMAAVCDNDRICISRVERPWTYDFIVDFRRYDGAATLLDDLTAFAAAWSEYTVGEDQGSHTAFISTNPNITALIPVISRLFPKDTIEFLEVDCADFGDQIPGTICRMQSSDFGETSQVFTTAIVDFPTTSIDITAQTRSASSA